MRVITRGGSSQAVGLAVLTVPAAIRFADTACARIAVREVFGPMTALLSGSAVRRVLLASVRRDRPSNGGNWCCRAEGYGLPSGHATNSALAAGLLIGLSRRRSGRFSAAAMPLGISYAVAVGLSRVYLGVHWPTDVLAGWALGAGWSVACDRWGLTGARKIRRAQDWPTCQCP
jgi:membrane-associated phospholipid phosphatase